MDDLISRAEAIEAIYNSIRYGEGYKAVCARAIERIPAVDAVPVVHGKWQWLSSTIDRIPCEMRYRCSECHHETITHTFDPWEYFCPNCGAKMDGDT